MVSLSQDKCNNCASQRTPKTIMTQKRTPETSNERTKLKATFALGCRRQGRSAAPRGAQHPDETIPTNKKKIIKKSSSGPSRAMGGVFRRCVAVDGLAK